MSKTASEYLVESLEKTGIKRVYGVVGDSLNGFTDAMRRRKSIDWIHMRHEEAAAFAAGAEAHLTGNLAVCAGSCGPGNLHLINGLFDCQRNGVPVLAIAAHIPSSEIGIDYFQATHPENLFKDCSHYVELVSNAKQLPQILKRAIRVAIAKRGVAVVVLPGDVALTEIDAEVPEWMVPTAPVMRPSPGEIDNLASFLNAASRVTLFCGAGCADAHDEVVELARKLKAPIVHAFRGKEFIEYDNPYDVGMTGLVGFASGYAAMKNCDALLLLGTDFPYRAFYPERAKIVQIDVRPEALGNRCSLHLGLLGTVKDTLHEMLPAIKEKTDSSHLSDALVDYKKARTNLDALAESGPHSNIIHPQYVTRLVSELAADDAVFTCDVGTPIIWTARYLKVNGRRRIIGSFNHGSMANAMLQAIGAQAAYPYRQVISMSGDGGFSMMMGDFITLTQMGLPVKVIVLNNGTLGFVEMEMKASGFLDTACDLKNPNFALMAEAMGVRGIRVEKPQELRAAIETALAHKGPVLVDVVSARQELAMPPKTTVDQAYHFGMFMMKAVLDGRASELIDLAKVNRFTLIAGTEDMVWTALLLSRVQFAFTVSFHIIFPSFTIGLAAWLVVLESFHLVTGEPVYRRLFEFWLRIFGVTFGLGVVSGVVLAFEFGMNWSRLSEVTGPIQGPLLIYESFTAFALEASFFGILIFGRNRVVPAVYLFSTMMVALGTTFSAFWIMVNNSWMQAPTGYAIENGIFIPTDWSAIIFSPVVWVRFPHMLVAAYLTGAFCVAATGAWYRLKGMHAAESMLMLRMGLFLAALLVPVQLFFGHLNGDYVHDKQPAKFAAIEGRWQDEQPAGEVFIAIPDEGKEQNYLELKIPYLGSLIASMRLDSKEIGLTSFPKQDRPPVAIPFFAFRVMVGCGLVMMALAWLGSLHLMIDLRRGKQLLLWLTFLSFPLPFIATLTGWFTAEVGRQPWSVYGMLRTADAVTPTLDVQAVTISLTVFAVVYLVIFSFGTLYVYRLLKGGPAQSENELAINPKRPLAIPSGIPAPGTAHEGSWT